MHDYKKVRKVVDGIHAEMALLVMDRLTKTESLTMGKPSAPKYARNKNILKENKQC